MSVSGPPQLFCFLLSPFLYLWSSSWLTSSDWPVWILSDWRVSSDSLLCQFIHFRWQIPSFSLSFGWHLWLSFLPLLVTNWPCSSDFPLVELLYIWRGKHSYFQTPIWIHTDAYAYPWPTHTCKHTHTYAFT